MPNTRRAVAEWIGKHPDAAIPGRVKLRILERWNWCCYITKTNLRELKRSAYQFEHIKALCNGGEHREFNIAPVLTIVHKDKTKEDVAEKHAVERTIRHHYQLDEPSRGFRRDPHLKARVGGGVKLRNPPPSEKKLPARRNLFTGERYD